jgi:hypothetical protein
VALARERKVKDVRPTKSQASSTLDKNASKWINIRICEYPNNFFSEVANQLYFNCCTKFISLKKDIINKHVDGPRHQSYQVQHKKRCNMQQNLHKYVQNHLQIINEMKAKLMVYRLEVCRVFFLEEAAAALKAKARVVVCFHCRGFFRPMMFPSRHKRLCVA